MSGELERHLTEVIAKFDSGNPPSMVEIQKTLEGDFANFAKLTRRLAASLAAPELNGELSPAEVAMIPEANARPWKPKGLPVAEIDCDLTIPGQGCLLVTLEVWGTFHAAHKGGHEKGERPYEPDDPAHFEVEAVMWGETDVTAEFGARDGIGAIAAYCMENCQPENCEHYYDDKPESDYCEDRR